MSEIPIGTVVFDGVSKRYRLGTLGTLRNTVEALTSRARGDNASRDLWALKDVSFRVEPGESLALVGPNGAGKTTTLKLLSKITRPTSGRIEMGGRTSSLIELGAGFHPELTGRENIYLNGAILGLSRREIAQRLDSVIAYSELENFIDTPVKRYSSGMYVRLGFAIAAHVEPDVLMVDEVLAVGDAAFRQKCMDRMQSLLKSGTTIIFVSHNMTQVEKLCREALLLVQGRVLSYGPTAEVLADYDRIVHASMQGSDARSGDQALCDGFYIQEVSIVDETGESDRRWKHDEILRVQIVYRAPQRIVDPIIKIRLIRHDGTVCGMSTSAYQPANRWTLEGEGEISLCIAPIQLVTGAYCVGVCVVDREDSMLLAGGQSEWFQVEGPSRVHETERGFFVPMVQWVHSPTPEPVSGDSDQ